MKLDLKSNPEQPLYMRLSTELRRLVEAGVLQPGDRLPSFSALRQATQHLVELGHRKIAYLSGGDETVVATRFSGFKDSMKAAGLKITARHQRKIESLERYGVRFIEAGYSAMQQWRWNTNCFRHN